MFNKHTDQHVEKRSGSFQGKKRPARNKKNVLSLHGPGTQMGPGLSKDSRVPWGVAILSNIHLLKSPGKKENIFPGVIDSPENQQGKIAHVLKQMEGNGPQNSMSLVPLVHDERRKTARHREFCSKKMRSVECKKVKIISATCSDTEARGCVDQDT